MFSSLVEYRSDLNLLTHLQAIGTKDGMVPFVEFSLAIVDTVLYCSDKGVRHLGRQI